MTMDTTLADSRTSANDAQETFSAAWWEARTAEELRDIINRGFAGGGTFHGAVAETERRAREATRRLRDAAVASASRRKRMKVAAIGALASVAVIAASAGVWFVR